MRRRRRGGGPRAERRGDQLGVPAQLGQPPLATLRRHGGSDDRMIPPEPFQLPGRFGDYEHGGRQAELPEHGQRQRERAGVPVVEGDCRHPTHRRSRREACRQFKKRDDGVVIA